MSTDVIVYSKIFDCKNFAKRLMNVSTVNLICKVSGTIPFQMTTARLLTLMHYLPHMRHITTNFQVCAVHLCSILTRCPQLESFETRGKYTHDDDTDCISLEYVWGGPYYHHAAEVMIADECIISTIHSSSALTKLCFNIRDIPDNIIESIKQSYPTWSIESSLTTICAVRK